MRVNNRAHNQVISENVHENELKFMIDQTLSLITVAELAAENPSETSWNL
jgi:hypothetical protein